MTIRRSSSTRPARSRALVRVELPRTATSLPGLPDAERLAEHARSHGVDVRLEVYPVAAQSFQLYWSFLPEAADAIARFGEYARGVSHAAG
ncbi:hypothetical protein [Actinoallomurus iriomotensis]|uniref:hypothetical protein n=1 Tax=Actinoallomurus iriomotensis TaxID=478107 RepID=UPI002557623C|nr:hypothetical protein [Actinoallomurus iriomotensis]